MDVNNRERRPSPLWEGWNVGSERRVVVLVDKDAEEGGGFVTRVGFQLRIDLDNEGGSYSREQTGLIPW